VRSPKPRPVNVAWSRRMVLLPAVVLAVIIAGGVLPTHAGWIDRLARIAAETGEVGGKAASHGIPALDRAAGLVKAVPTSAKGAGALAVHVTQEGHWKFVNRAGEVFTAGTPEELARAIPTLAPELGAAGAKAKPSLYLTESTVFEQRAALKDLPKEAELHVVVGDESFGLVRRAGSAGETLFAEVRPNIVVELNDKSLFDEAVWQLQRRLNKADIRVLSLTPGGPDSLSSVPKFDTATKAALVDAIDPDRLTRSLSSLRRQTVVITGRSDGGLLRFQPASGGERSLVLKDLAQAAEQADVNLIILESPAPRQPGGRNWMWQRIEVKGLDEAMKRATFADFLNTLGAERGQLAVTATRETNGRVLVRTLPSGSAASPLTTEGITNWWGDVIGDVAGRVVIHGAHAFMRSEERQRELDARIVPGVPTWVQIPYLGAMAIGLMAWPVSSRWWRRLWPAENRSDYPGRVGYWLARVVRGAAFLLIYLPLAGIPAFLAMLAMQIGEVLMAPVRLLRWIGGRLGFGRP